MIETLVTSSWFLLLIPALPLFGFLVNGFLALANAKGKTVSPGFSAVLACLMPFFSFLLAGAAFLYLHETGVPALKMPVAEWFQVAGLSVSFGLLLDHLSIVMTLVITGVGSLIHLYSTGYMKGDEGFVKYFSYLNLFLFFMLLLVMGDSLLLLFVGWEGVGLCSYLLIGFWFTDEEKAKAGQKAFLVNRVGDFAFLIGLFTVAWAFLESNVGQTEGLVSAMPWFSFDFLRENAALLSPFIFIITMGLFLGATGKSAQIPLYVWLPDAMAGPTPVSALIHAATMVTAGIYMIARLGFLFTMSPMTMDIIATVGLATACLAACIAVVQNDIKKVLAYSTVSQLGYMFLALGVGAFSSALFHVVTHAFFKACLFLGAGSVIHALHHEQDLRNMGGLFRKMPITAATFLISTLAIAGLPPFSGFFSKDEILYMVYASDLPKTYYVLGMVTAGLTAFYMTRLMCRVFFGKPHYHHHDKVHESPAVMTLPLIILATLAATFGFVGLPHILGHNHFADWLALLGQHTPHHIEGSSLQEAHLMGISAAWAAFMILFTVVLYAKFPKVSSWCREKFRPLHSLLENKFYVDELYEIVILKPIRVISDVVLFRGFDRFVFDGVLAHGLANLSATFGQAFRNLQTGFLGHAVFLLFGALVFILSFMFWG